MSTTHIIEILLPVSLWPRGFITASNGQYAGWGNVSIERLGAQAKIRKKTLHLHDVAREVNSIEIDV